MRSWRRRTIDPNQPCPASQEGDGQRRACQMGEPECLTTASDSPSVSVPTTVGQGAAATVRRVVISAQVSLGASVVAPSVAAAPEAGKLLQPD